MKTESLKEFADTVVTMLKSELGGHYEITSGEVLKNNSVRLFGITIRKANENIAPTIYVNEYYEDFVTGRSLSDIVRQIIEIYQTTSEGRTANCEFSLDYGDIEDKICFRVVNAEKNREMLDGVPFVPILDLVLTFFIVYSEVNTGVGSVQITNKMLEGWGVDRDKIILAAVRNTPRLFPMRFGSLEDRVREIMSEKGLEPDFAIDGSIGSEMFILTNSEGFFGASSIFYYGTAQRISAALSEYLDRRVPSGVIVIPSSIHELIVIPEDRIPGCKEIREMIRSVNEEVVLPTDYLSKNAYRFNLETEKLEILSEENINRKEFCHAY